MYNQKDQGGTGLRTVERALLSQEIPANSLILGDFNLHHPWWDPLTPVSPGIGPFINWLEERDLVLLNSPGEGTFFRKDMVRQSVLDLTLVIRSLYNSIEDWQILPSIGSDHLGILFTIKQGTQNLAPNPIYQGRYNLRKANWAQFKETFISKIKRGAYQITTPSIDDNKDILKHGSTSLIKQLEGIAKQLSDAISEAADQAIPRLKPGARPKPWWDEELLLLRREVHRRFSLISTTSLIEVKETYLQAKNTYFSAIKRKKREHWEQFLQKEDPKSIYKAMAYTKDRLVERIPQIRAGNNQLQDSFTGKCSAFRESLFPPPPQAETITWEDFTLDPAWDWPELTQAEVEQACSTQIKGKTPGPDAITQDIIIAAYQACPEIFFKVFSLLFNSGYHPII